MALTIKDSMQKEYKKEKCTPCEENGLKAFALFYCRECLEIYCIPCAKQHKNLNEVHLLIPRSESYKWGKVRKASSFVQEEDTGLTLSQPTVNSDGVRKRKSKCVLI